MSAFDYLSVLISIILGLAVTQILQGFRDLMQARSRLTTYWPLVLWAILLLLICIQEWWAMFGWRDYPDWTFFGFSLVIAQVVGTYLVAALVLPDVAGDGPLDLRAYFFANHRWLFTLGAFTVLASIAKDRVLSGRWPSPALNLVMELVLIVIFAIGASSASERVHKVLAPLAAIWFALYVLLLFRYLH